MYVSGNVCGQHLVNFLSSGPSQKRFGDLCLRLCFSGDRDVSIWSFCLFSCWQTAGDNYFPSCLTYCHTAPIFFTPKFLANYLHSVLKILVLSSRHVFTDVSLQKVCWGTFLSNIKTPWWRPGMVEHACNLSSVEGICRRIVVWGKLGKKCETLSEK
jgi:hypothetical protein